MTTIIEAWERYDEQFKRSLPIIREGTSRHELHLIESRVIDLLRACCQDELVDEILSTYRGKGCFADIDWEAVAPDADPS